MNRIIFLSLIVFGFLSSAAQVHIPFTRLTYDARYSFGPINVSIGTGEVTVQTYGDNFVGTLNGKSIPWRGRVYCISDTLRTEMHPTHGFSSESVEYVNGWYRKPKAEEYESAGYNPDNPQCYKNIKGFGLLDASNRTMEAISIMADMLAMYYYAHQINFPAMKEGQVITLPIKTPDGPEQVRIRYKGPSSINICGQNISTYRTVFEYSYKGEMSGYEVALDIAANNRIPLKFSSDLPIGHVEMTCRL